MELERRLKGWNGGGKLNEANLRIFAAVFGVRNCVGSQLYDGMDFSVIPQHRPPEGQIQKSK